MKKSETAENIEEARKKDAPGERPKTVTVKDILEEAREKDVKGQYKEWKVYRTRKRFCPTFTR